MPFGRVAADAHHRPIHGASHKNRTKLRKERHRLRKPTDHCGAPVSQWGTTFTDPRMCAAIADRLTSKVASIRTDTDAYGFKAVATSRHTNGRR